MLAPAERAWCGDDREVLDAVVENLLILSFQGRAGGYPASARRPPGVIAHPALRLDVMLAGRGRQLAEVWRINSTSATWVMPGPHLRSRGRGSGWAAGDRIRRALGPPRAPRGC